MATRKLNVELDIETSKAKQKIKTLGEDAGSAYLAGSADRAAKALDSTASSANKLTQASKMSAERLRSIATAFGGLGIRMATAYAASNMQEGSAGQTAVQVGGGAIAGALQGAVAGPLGALAGGIMGLTTELISANAKAREAERARREAIIATCDANREQLEALWAAEERTHKFKEAIKELTSVEDISERKTRIQAEIEKKEKEVRAKDSDLMGATDHFWGGKDGGEKFKKLMGERQSLTGELEQLRNLLEAADGDKKQGPAFRVSETATDALTRIGGNFGGGDVNKEILDTAIKSLETLSNIEKNTKKGGSTWQ